MAKQWVKTSKKSGKTSAASTSSIAPTAQKDTRRQTSTSSQASAAPTAPAEVAITKRIPDNISISMLFTLLVSAFIIVVPFYRGLFFRVNYIPAIIILSAIFVVYILYKLKDKTPLLTTYMDLAVLAIPIIYGISFFFAANKKDAFDILLIYASYFMIYKITHSLIKSDIKNKTIFVNVIIASTFLLSLTGMLHIMGVLNLQSVYVSKRLFGLYQYPNTTASVLGVGIILTLNNLINTDNLNLKALYQSVLTALISAFIFTISRGGYLVLAGVLLLNFLLINAKSKLQFIINIFISFLSSSLLIYKFYTIPEAELKIAGTYYFAGIILSAALAYIIFYLKKRSKIQLSDKTINISLLILIIVLAIILILLFTAEESTLLKFMPSTIANRFKDISFKTRNVSLRIYFSLDGLKILKDYPLAGAGGGAWKNLYRQYQSIPYNTTETHNFYVQFATETGGLGLIALGAIHVFLIIGMFKSIKDKSGYMHIYLAAMFLLLHSVLDFNLSLAAVGYLLWMLIGILNSHEGIMTVDKPALKYSKFALLALSAAALISSSSIYYGMKLGVQAVGFAKEKDIEKAITVYEKAIKFDKYNTTYRYDLSQIMNNELRKTKDKKYYDGFEKQLSMIKKYEPYNFEHVPVICNMLLAIGKFDEASTLADEWIAISPMIVAPYCMKIDINYQIAKYHLEKEEIEKALPYLEKIMDAEKQLEAENEKIKDVTEKSKIVEGVEYLKFTDDYPKKLEASLRTLNMVKEDLGK